MHQLDTFQFFPTPPSLAAKAWGKFKNRSFSRVLEPSAGEGHLLEFGVNKHWIRKTSIDCIEVNLDKHSLLREKGYNVIGVDFMDFQGSSLYSHIILNPPFAKGAAHVIKAWDLMYEGEIVAIINKETLENPFSKERKHLVNLIETHGSVEYLTETFMTDETLRKTEVEIALVHLTKVSNFNENLAGDILDKLKVEQSQDSDHAGYKEINGVAIANSTIKNAVLAFNAAVIANKEQVFAAARGAYYRNMIGSTLERMHTNYSGEDASLKWVSDQLNEMYVDLKNRAWANVLRSSEVMGRLSSKAQKRLEKEFENIKKLEFTEVNIYGFLLGISNQQSTIQMDMVLDIFDEITKYSEQNTVFYMGWKSNNKHKTAGMRIKMTRFVLPNNRKSFGSGLEYDAMQRLRDFDKVFFMLDGKKTTKLNEFGQEVPNNTLAHLFETRFNDLVAGERLSSEYFECRYYPGIATIHFYPKNKSVVDRLNRLVGAQRAWIPEDTSFNEEFMAHYEDAEKFDKEFRHELKKHNNHRFEHLLWQLNSSDDQYRLNAQKQVTDALTTVLEKRGYNVNKMLAVQDRTLLTA